MKTIKNTILLSILMALVVQVKAQDQVKTNIFQALTSDSTGKGKVIIHQDKQIETIVLKEDKPKNKTITTTASGYRVQVFSSNEKTAKADAYNIEKQVKDLFPNQNIYVNYSSPSWKVRVGDFVNQTQALDFQTELINNFPNLRSDIYVVKEQIIITQSKK